MSDSIKMIREAAADMRNGWECNDDCDPAEREFYRAVADWLDEEADSWATEPDNDGIPYYRPYLVARAYRGWAE